MEGIMEMYIGCRDNNCNIVQFRAHHFFSSFSSSKLSQRLPFDARC